MRLTITNIGKIRHAAVEFNGITVIAGANDTGKSTVSKSLYYISNCFCDLQRKIERIRIGNIFRTLFHSTMDWNMSEGDEGNLTEIAESIVKDRDSLKDDSKQLASKLEELYRKFDIDVEDKSVFKQIVEEVGESLQVDDDRIKTGVFQNGVDSEFERQINNVFSDGEGKIQLSLDGQDLEVVFSKDEIVSFASANIKGIDLEPVYIDDPFVLDGNWRFWPRPFMFGRSDDHRTNLKAMLRHNKNKDVLDGVIANSKLEQIYSKIKCACSGDFVLNKRARGEYREAGSGKAIRIGNLSMGLKSFLILKMLLENGSLKRNGIVILDEPENHLHPEWQLLFAELIVLIQKEFNLRLLLNTHSPYFFHAIRVYARKYETEPVCKFYLASVPDSDFAKIDDVSTEVKKIYEKLAKPLQDLEDTEYPYGD